MVQCIVFGRPANGDDLTMFEAAFVLTGQDSDSFLVTLGVCAIGVLVYKDSLRIHRLAWPKILKITYKRNSFHISIRSEEVNIYEFIFAYKSTNKSNSTAGAVQVKENL